MQSKNERLYYCMVYTILQVTIFILFYLGITYLYDNYKFKNAWMINIFIFSIIFIIIGIFKYYAPQCSTRQRILRYINNE